jgi:von Willebrand factor type A domain
MNVLGNWLRRSLSRRYLSLIAAMTGLLAVGFGPTVAPAAAETPAHTDVMLVFDTSGSMEGQLEEAKQEIQEVIAHVNATLPDVQYGVAEVKDYAKAYGNGPEEIPWKLDQALTSNAASISTAIAPLKAFGGGDGPEAYGRALWETDTNPNIGWRAGARHIIILIADNVPHDNNLDEGIPESQWAEEGKPAPWNTGEELPGTQNIPGSVWGPGVSTDFQTTLGQLNADGKTLGMVDFRGTESGYLPYWEYWAGLTGGQALVGGSKELASKVTTLIETRATTTLPSCPAGQVRNASGVCVTIHPTVTQVICNLVIATASDTCTATVADAAATEASNPTGTVAFTSASGGVFSAGNTCSLVSTPLSPNVSSCSVQFLPPSAPSTLPAITAAYSGDSLRAASSGSTHYAPASELAKDVDLSDAGTITPGGTIEVPVTCGFPCEISGGLDTLPDLASLASFSGLSVEPAVLTATTAKHSKKKKKKKAKAVQLGTGKLKLSAPGKGKLVIKLSSKGKRALSHVGSKGVHLTVKFTISTLNGTLVAVESKHVTLRPKKKSKGHGKGKKGKK